MEHRGDRKTHVPPGLTITFQLFYSLSGMCNVLLFLFTHQGLWFLGRNDAAGIHNGPSYDNADDTDSIEGGHRE
jgi:hypothetical protein